MQNFIYLILFLELLGKFSSAMFQTKRIHEIDWNEFLTTNTEVRANSNKIKSLKGLENFANLKAIYITKNQIMDLSPLKRTDR